MALKKSVTFLVGIVGLLGAINVASAQETTVKSENANAPDHEKFAGRLAIGYMGLSRIDYGASTLTGTAVGPVIGARYWLNKQFGLDVGLGFLFASGSATVTSGGNSVSTDSPSLFGFGLHGGVPIALAAGRHYTFEVIPELNLAFATSSAKNYLGSNFDVKSSGFRFEVGARAGAEIHFGFIGIPELALQATIGLGLRVNTLSTTRTPLVAGQATVEESRSSFGLGTSVQDTPWAIFTNTISALYYF